MKRLYHTTDIDGIKTYYIWYMQGIDVVASYLIKIIADEATLCDVYVEPEHRGKGYSSMMLYDADEQLLGLGRDRMVLWVRKDSVMRDKYIEHGYTYCLDKTDEFEKRGKLYD